MRISDWSSDVCSSDLGHSPKLEKCCRRSSLTTAPSSAPGPFGPDHMLQLVRPNLRRPAWSRRERRGQSAEWDLIRTARRSEEHTSELQSLMRISYAVFCLKKKKHKHKTTTNSERNEIRTSKK